MADLKFEYKGRLESGREVTGQVEAENQELAVQVLRENGITATHLKAVKEGILSKEIPGLSQLRPISRRGIMLFTHQLAAMLSAGVPLPRALSTTKETVEPKLKKIIEQLARDVESGSTFMEALQKHPDVFDNLYLHMVEAGEESGQLDYALERIVEGMERTQRLNRKVRKAMAYPTVLLAGMVVVVLFVVSFIVPRFAPLYAELGSNLPASTQAVIAASEIMRPSDGGLVPLKPLLWVLFLVGVSVIAYIVSWKQILPRLTAGIASIVLLILGTWFIIMLPIPGSVGHTSLGLAMLFRMVFFTVLIFAVIRAFKYLVNTPDGRYFWDQFKIRIPWIGSVIEKVSLARFATTLSVLYSAGVPIDRALEFVAPGTGNVVLEKAVLRVRRRILAGETIGESFRGEKIFPPVMMQMISIADETSGLSQQLTKVSEYYEDDVDSVIENLDSVIEPIMILLVGSIIGVVVIALYMPMFSLYQQLANYNI